MTAIERRNNDQDGTAHLSTLAFTKVKVTPGLLWRISWYPKVPKVAIR